MARKGVQPTENDAPPGATYWARVLAAWLPWVLMAIGAAVDLFIPGAVLLSSLFAAAPLVAAPFLAVGVTVTISAVSSVLHTVLVFRADHGDLVETALRSVNVVTVAVIAVGINYLARRSTAELATVRSVAEVAQRAVMPVPPRSVGELDIAARYEAAQAEARIGGDLYAVQETPYGVRLLVGDVRGKGLPAVEMLSTVIGAFREAAEQERTLQGVTRRLDRALLRQAELRPEGDALENFMTAVLVEVPPGGWDVLRIVNCGHPEPLLRGGDGRVRALRPSRYTMPLGLGVVPEEEQDRAVDEETFPPGGVLLLYTDGVSEARDDRGEFFDPEAWLRRCRLRDPRRLLEELVADVTAYAGGRVADDMALLAVGRRSAASSPRSARESGGGPP